MTREAMRKKAKAVPEWLNSPLWSTPPLASTPADPFGTDFSPPPAPSPKPSPSVPPPPMREQAVDSYAGRGGEIREEDGAGAALRAHLLADFKAALSKKVVNMGELRRLACLGVPDGGGTDVRPLVWKCAASFGVFAN
ncbi:unnamed protein product [Triticum turgidum subsp. durum]|uniref:Uncharacterized protein n=1 Tax=Triticum turgidum subsp. durum TaxID=4567 RepID=A0A9R1BRH3_TRITD|nr:unnamed protein product [Triticum turgidum subsp. durum]